MIFYEAERYIAEAIESVLGQSFTDYELLLVDDGSTDAGTAIARGYADRHAPRVRYLEHEGHANRGACAARNLGLRHARGEFVAFIDSDDVWRPGKLADQVRIMDLHPELGMVCGAVRYWNSWAGGEDAVVPSGHVQDRVVLPPEAALEVYPLGDGAAPCPSDLLMRRDLVLSLGGFEERFTGPRQLFEDQAFLAKLYLAAPVYFAGSVWLDYRQHAASCVADVTRSGRKEEVRRFFFHWLADYVAGRPSVEARVLAALDSKLWPYRHPHLDRARRLSARFVAGARRRVRRLAPSRTG
jgi:glycosyltransferase involved in cell wall biosynthesis